LRIYLRSPCNLHNGVSPNENQKTCASLLIEGGTAYEDTPVFDMHWGRLDAMQQRLRADPAHVHNRFGSPAEDIYPVGGSFG